MKQIKCEMCGGNEFLKKNDVFVCQTCGTKYSTDEAKKLIVEGSIDVSGSKVKIDESNKIDNYRKLMIDANFHKDFKSVLKYANKILEIDGNDMIAKYFANNAYISRDIRDDITHYIFGLFREEYKISLEYFIKNKEFILNCIKELNEKYYDRTLIVSNLESSIKIFGLKNTHNWRKIFDILIDEFKDKDFILLYYDLLFAYVNACINSQVGTLKNQNYIEHIRYNLKPEDYKKEISQYSYIDNKLDDLCIEHKKIDKDIYQNYMNDLEEAINYYNRKKNNSNAKGCYVATCVYGSYDCPEVWTLRRFRDIELENILIGRIFIKVYYLISPKLIKFFGKYIIFKSINKIWLDKLVNYLNIKGYSSRPYNDTDGM